MEVERVLYGHLFNNSPCSDSELYPHCMSPKQEQILRWLQMFDLLDIQCLVEGYICSVAVAVTLVCPTELRLTEFH